MAQVVRVTAHAKDFEYQVGMWERPINDEEPAKLIYGDNIFTTAEVDAFALGDMGTAYIRFCIAKPKLGERCFGWHDSNLQFKAVLGNKSATFGGLGKMYHSMPWGKVSTFGMNLDLSGNTDPIHKKLQFCFSDDATTPKAGLELHWALVEVK